MQHRALSIVAHDGLMGRFGRLLLASALAFPVGGAVAQQTNVQDECYRNTEQYIPAYTTPDGRYQNG